MASPYFYVSNPSIRLILKAHVIKTLGKTVFSFKNNTLRNLLKMIIIIIITRKNRTIYRKHIFRRKRNKNVFLNITIHWIEKYFRISKTLKRLKMERLSKNLNQDVEKHIKL